MIMGIENESGSRDSDHTPFAYGLMDRRAPDDSIYLAKIASRSKNVGIFFISYWCFVGQLGFTGAFNTIYVISSLLGNNLTSSLTA